MSWKPILATLLLLGAMVPSAQAIGIEAPTLTTLGAESTTALSFNVTASCDEFVPDAITGTGSVEYTVTVTEPPTWLNATDTSVTFDATACITGADPAATLQESGSIDLTTAAGAPGMTPTTITLEADDGATADTDVQVEYVHGYMLMFDAEAFPMEIGGDAETFNATLHLFANARSMAMFQVVEKPEYLSVSGLPDFKTVGDDELAGELEFMQDYPITVTPPSTGTWEEDSITFKTWSHFLDDGNVKTEDETITWTFTNAAPASTGGDDSNDSPGGGVVLVGLGLLGAAFVALRRRK